MLAAQPPQAGSLLVLPEMFATGFSMQLAQTIQSTDRPCEAFLRRMAAAYGVTVLGGVVTAGRADLGRNQAVAFAPDGQEQARYTKVHPFSFIGEQTHYEPGDEIVLFNWRGMKVAPLICYDLRFGELFRHAVRAGAQLLIVLANWPAARHHHWRSLLLARAIENQAYVIGANRCGSDPHANYPGASIIIDPLGEVLAEAGAEPMMLEASLDHQKLLALRKTFPALGDLREDLLGRFPVRDRS